MVKHLVAAQNEFFATQKTKEVTYRKYYLKKLQQEILDQEDAICNALYADFKNRNSKASPPKPNWFWPNSSTLSKIYDHGANPIA